ncbi:hypothetical protein Barb4_01476 [Bacteroidales bacterium Barb4]|nr:hypothetical protein Barb4_01476 [Bacteroidales bacterium Barb4]
MIQIQIIFTMQPVTIYILSSFQDFLADNTNNPIFRCAACGAEIFCPFRASA